MTAGQSYSVDVVYTGRDHGATATADSISGRLVALQGRIDSVVGAFDSMARGAAMLGVGAAMMGVRTLLSGVSGLNAQAEETTLTIAGMLNANGVAPTIGEGMRSAAATLRQIRVDAAALPGEAAEFVTIFQLGLPAALQAGMRDARAVAAFTNQFGAVGKSFGVDAPQIGRDLRLLLQGHAGGHVAMWNHIGPLIGKSAQQFNQMTAPQRLAALQQVTARYGGMVQAYGGTWEAATSTIRSAGSELLRVGTQPLFEHAKRRVAQLADYLTTRGPDLERKVGLWGERLAAGFDRAYERAVRLFHYIAEHRHRILGDAEGRARDVAGAYVHARGASGVLGAVGGVEGVAGLARTLGLMGGAAGGAAGAAGGALAQVGALASAFPVATAAVAGTTVALGALALHMRDEGYTIGWVATQAKEKFSTLITTFDIVGTSARPLVDAFTSFPYQAFAAYGSAITHLAGPINALGTVVGAVVSVIMDVHMHVINTVKSAFERAGVTFGIGAARVGLLNGMSPEFAPERDAHDPTREVGGFRSSATSRPGGDNPNTAPRPAHTTIHNHFRIEQADNPERVALTVVHLLQREMRHPTQARVPGLQTLRPVGL